MAKNEKTIRQAYPATVIVDGEPVAPGTAVTLPETEANSIAAMFGVITATAEHKASASAVTEPAKKKVTPAALKVLENAVTDARAVYDAAEKALDKPDAGAAEATAFTDAETALNEAEAKLTEAKGQ